MKTSVLSCFALVALAPLAQAAPVTIIAPGSSWEYTFTDPTANANWNQTTGGWQVGLAPFSTESSGDFAAGTYWPADGDWADDLWVRQAIDLSGIALGSLQWFIGVDNGYKLYINGSLISSANAEGFTSRWEYSGTVAPGLLHSGQNVIALALEDHGGLTAFDLQLTGETAPRQHVPDAAGTAGLLGLTVLGLAAWRRRT